MRYKVFGRRTGLRVSEISLGTGMFGTGWGHGAEPAEARRIFDGYVAAGGNFFDCADVYQFGQSETLLGEFIAAERDTYVVATKYTSGAKPDGGLSVTGNSRKNMIYSVEASLRRLKTDRIDLYWVHRPDGVTPVDEIMRGLDDLVRAGKVIYVGLSNFPAWRVAGAAVMADLRGWAPVAGLQVEYSLVERTAERELMPMADAFGLGTVAWSPLGGGVLTGKYRRGEKGRATETKLLVHRENEPRKVAVVDTVHGIAEELGVKPGQVAIAWICAKGIIPLIGNRTRAQFEDNLAAASVKLTDEQIARLDTVSDVPLGVPHGMLTRRRPGDALDLVDLPATAVI